jgi:hypothetical protein
MISKRARRGVWFGRFLRLTIINGALAAGWTVFIVWPWLTPPPSVILTEGSAGTWLPFGYLLFLILGVVAMAVTPIFYYFLEVLQGRVYYGFRSLLATGHLVFWEVGVVGATFLMMYAGYRGGVGLLATSEGGGGLTASQVHAEILQYYIDPIFAFSLIAIVGAMLGGLGYALSERGLAEKIAVLVRSESERAA